MNSQAIGHSPAPTFRTPAQQKPEPGTFKDRKVSTIESIKLFFKKIWHAVRDFFVSLYERFIKKQQAVQPKLPTPAQTIKTQSTTVSSVEQAQAREKTTSYNTQAHPKEKSPNTANNLQSQSQAKQARTSLPPKALSKPTQESSSGKIAKPAAAQNAELALHNAQNCFHSNRAAFRMLAGTYMNSVDGKFTETAPMRHELDQLKYQRNQAASATYTPEGVPFVNFFYERTVGLLIDTGNGKIVKESSVGDCGTVPCDIDGCALSWSIERHQYEKTVVGHQAQYKVKRDFHHYKILNPDKRIAFNGEYKSFPMQKDFSEFKKIILESYKSDPNSPQRINETILDYDLSNVVGIVQVNQPDYQKHLEKDDRELAKMYQKQIRNQLGKELPILSYNKDNGSIKPLQKVVSSVISPSNQRQNKKNILGNTINPAHKFQNTTKPSNFILTDPAQWTDGKKVKKLKGNIHIANMNSSDQEKQRIKTNRLNKEEWASIFKKINRECLDKPYAGDSYHKHKGVWRPNHNGTHAARQARLFEVLHSLVKKSTSHGFHYTNEELNSLQLAAYCYRAGRVDETGGGKDQNRLRSAQVFKAHAQQMGFSDRVIKWTFDIISRDFFTPLNNEKQECAYQLLDIAHRLDLQRCFYKRWMAPEIAHINKTLRKWGLADHQDRLFQFARKLIDCTGYRNNYYKTPIHLDKFKRCSKDGEFCWKEVSSQRYQSTF